MKTYKSSIYINLPDGELLCVNGHIKLMLGLGASLEDAIRNTSITWRFYTPTRNFVFESDETFSTGMAAIDNAISNGIVIEEDLPAYD